MTQNVVCAFVDDIDGSPAEQTFTFAVDGVFYEIDLSADNIAKFKSAIGGFIESARKVKVSRRNSKRSRHLQLQNSGQGQSRKRIRELPARVLPSEPNPDEADPLTTSPV
jgi:hypothetical protein